MASEASTYVPRLSSGSDGQLALGGAANKSSPDKSLWQGNVWINGLLHEHNVYLIDDTKAINNLSGGAWENVQLGMDCLLNEIALQEAIPKEIATCHSGLPTWLQDYVGNESVPAVGRAAEKSGSDEPKWDFVRHCKNGLLHEQDFYMINDSKAVGNHTGILENIDRMANGKTHQEAMPKETSACQSSNHSTWQQGYDSALHDFGGCDLDPVTAAIRRWEIWEPSVSLLDCNRNANPITVPFSKLMPSQSVWSAVDTGWQNVYSDVSSEKSPQIAENDFVTPLSSEDRLIHDPIVPTECDPGIMDLLDERKIIQEFPGDGRLQDTIMQEALKGKLWPVHFLGERGFTCRDDNFPGLADDFNTMKKMTWAEESTGNYNEAGSSTYLCTKHGLYDSGTKCAETKSPDLESNHSVNNVKSSSILHDAFMYTFSYLNWHDLLAVERVCKLFRDSVRDDALLWQQLHVGPPFNKKLTDERLLQLAARAKGQLRCLSLVDCFRVSEAAVEQVARLNPMISKLCLPGCSKITADAVLRIVKGHMDHKVAGMPGLKQLRIRNIYGLTREHLDNLHCMLQASPNQTNTSKPQFYLNGHSSLSYNEQRPIDVEACPKCDNVRIVYDCTREKCQQRLGSKLQECRGCIICIARCEECGRCIDDNDYEETFCLDLLCSACWVRLPKCAECNGPRCC